MTCVTQIPNVSRALVRIRERHRCARCAMPAPHGEWHHRRSRSVRDVHEHCACNGIWLCSTCHRWVHAHPFEARGKGFIVSRFTNEPGTVPVDTPWGLRRHTCDGAYHLEEGTT